MLAWENYLKSMCLDLFFQKVGTTIEHKSDLLE